MNAATVLPRGAAIGVLGGGQLGRMLASAAARLGFDVHVYTPQPDSPAARVAAAATVAAYDDLAALEAFAGLVDVVTFEFENVPATAVEALSRAALVRPGAPSLAASQDRLAEKRLLASLGLAVAPHAPVDGPDDLAPAYAAVGPRAILKTRRLGYDGKGQARVMAADDLAAAFTALEGAPSVLEAMIDFSCEVSAIVARDAGGAIVSYDVAENRHADGMLRESRAPARVEPRMAAEAVSGAERLAHALDHVGVLCVEYFVAADGRLIANEFAPRVHNSGHWTEAACRVSQFEQHIRAVAGWPLGDPARHADAFMVNLIGSDIDAAVAIAAAPNACLTDYGKRDAVAGRKMGHVTYLQPKG
jgi:5-(carboxyamino)imidazole ribonucleotide synthase